MDKYLTVTYRYSSEELAEEVLKDLGGGRALAIVGIEPVSEPQESIDDYMARRTKEMNSDG